MGSRIDFIPGGDVGRYESLNRVQQHRPEIVEILDEADPSNYPEEGVPSRSADHAASVLTLSGYAYWPIVGSRRTACTVRSLRGSGDVMPKRAVAIAGFATTLTLLIAAPTAHADSGPPPPPVSTNGHKVQLVASGLKTPTSFAFGAGKVFVGDGGNSEGSAPPNGGVYVLKNGTAVKIASRVKFVAGLAWHDKKLYVSGAILANGHPSWRLMAWSGWNGTTFTGRKTLYVAGKKFDGFNGIGFGANGRLYVGVDVGLTDGNDHGPASTSPYLYDILTFRANGKDLQVFAKGMRQPWQFAFQRGSNAPFVTDLGQDSGATNDFVLHVNAGDNYGFPKCNRTSPSKCRGFTKPFRSFGPHTDLMGIAVHAGTLYMTSFMGKGGKGPGGEVFTLDLTSHSLKPLVKGLRRPYRRPRVAPPARLRGGTDRAGVPSQDLTRQVRSRLHPCAPRSLCGTLFR